MPDGLLLFRSKSPCESASCLQGFFLWYNQIMYKTQRCFIVIDGSNFYFKLKDLDLHNLLKFDFSGFVRLLAGKDKIVSATYYVGKIKTDGTEKTQKLFDNQRKLLACLKKYNLKYSLGYLMK